MKAKYLCLICSCLFAVQNAQAVELCGAVKQGEIVFGKAHPGTKWDIQNIKGVPPRKVTPSDSDLEAIELESKVVKAAVKGVYDNTFWQSGFIRPVEGRISGKFGGQRILNDIPKNPHQGMDIAAKEGTPVKAIYKKWMSSAVIKSNKAILSVRLAKPGV